MAWLPLPKQFDPDFEVPGRKPLGPVKIDGTRNIGYIDYRGDAPSSMVGGGLLDWTRQDLFSDGLQTTRFGSGTKIRDTSTVKNFRVDSTLGPKGFISHQVDLSQVAKSTYVFMSCRYNGGPNTLIWTTNNGTTVNLRVNGSTVTFTPPASLSSGGSKSITFYWDDFENQRGLIIDGVIVATSGTAFTWADVDPYQMSPWHDTSLGEPEDGIVSSTFFGEYESLDQLVNESIDPYCMLRPESAPLAFFAATGGDTNINANTEQVSVTTLQAVIESGTTINANTEQISLQAQIAQLAQDIQAQLEQITLTTQTADLGIEVVANTEQLTLSTLLASVSNNVDITANTEQIIVTEQQADVVAGTVIDAFTEQIQLATNPAVIESATNIDGVTEQITLNALPGNVVLGTLIQAGTEQIQVTVNQGQVQLDGSISAQTEQIILTELAAQVGIEQNIDANAESITITPQGAEIVFESGVVANTELISLTTNQATIEGVVAVPLGPGLEYTLNQSQIRYTLGINKLHFTLTPED